MFIRSKFFGLFRCTAFTLCSKHVRVINYFVLGFSISLFLNQYNVLAVDLAPLPLPSAESLAIDFREKFLKLANEQMTYMIPAIGFALIIRKLSS